MQKEDRLPAVSNEEYFRLDKELYERLSDAFLAGTHLPLLYRFAHPGMRLNEMQAFRLIRDHQELPLSTESILSIYQAMTAGTELAGKGFKTEDCCIESDEFIYFTVPANQTAAAVDSLCGKYSFLSVRLSGDPGTPLSGNLDDIFRFLLEFICIHPMEDGNGRLSVFLIQLLMQKAGLACAPYLPYDYLQNLMYRGVYQKHIVKASGIFFGQKPLAYDDFVRFSKGLLLIAYRLLSEAVDAGQFPL